MNLRCLNAPLYVWDSETHELLGTAEPMQWLSETDIPLDRPLTLCTSSESCGCEGCGS